MKCLLLVDDDTNFRHSLAVALETVGYRVHEARSGMEALKFLNKNQRSKNRVNGVILDARMPGLDGFWIADQISLIYPDVSVVLLSAYSHPDCSERYTLLSKPIRIPTLTETIENSFNISGVNINDERRVSIC